MTMIESALFDDWESWEDDRFPILQWAETGERLTRDSFARYRTEGGGVIIHSRTADMTRTAIENPLTMIASDGLIEDGRGHPRTAGTYSKVLGKYVREEWVLTLMDALRRMTIEPARRLAGYVPAMETKGRLSVGADADITILDAGTVIDRSTYTNPTLPSEGIPYVLVNGVLVVEGGELVPDARPGRAIRDRDSQSGNGVCRTKDCCPASPRAATPNFFVFNEKKNWCRRRDSASRVPPNTDLSCKVLFIRTLQRLRRQMVSKTRGDRIPLPFPKAPGGRAVRGAVDVTIKGHEIYVGGHLTANRRGNIYPKQ